MTLYRYCANTADVQIYGRKKEDIVELVWQQFHGTVRTPELRKEIFKRIPDPREIVEVPKGMMSFDHVEPIVETPKEYEVLPNFLIGVYAGYEEQVRAELSYISSRKRMKLYQYDSQVIPWSQRNVTTFVPEDIAFALQEYQFPKEPQQIVNANVEFSRRSIIDLGRWFRKR